MSVTRPTGQVFRLSATQRANHKSVVQSLSQSVSQHLLVLGSPPMTPGHTHTHKQAQVSQMASSCHTLSLLEAEGSGVSTESHVSLFQVVKLSTCAALGSLCFSGVENSICNSKHMTWAGLRNVLSCSSLYQLLRNKYVRFEMPMST